MAADPFESARADVHLALRGVQRLQADAFAGDAGAARRLPGALASLDEELAALDGAVAAMARAPARFGLTHEDVAERRAAVAALWGEAAEVQRICAGAGVGSSGGGLSGGGGYGGGGGGGYGGRVSGGLEDVDLGDSPRSRGPPGLRPPGVKDAAKAGGYYHRQLGQHKGAAAAAGGGSGSRDVRPAPDAAGGGWGPGDHGQYGQEQLQARLVRQQDDMLGDIEMQVGRIKHAGMAMGEELEQQSLLLGGLQEDADSAYLRLRGAQKKVLQFTRAARSDRQLQLICLLSVVLAVLVVTAFM